VDNFFSAGCFDTVSMYIMTLPFLVSFLGTLFLFLFLFLFLGVAKSHIYYSNERKITLCFFFTSYRYFYEIHIRVNPILSPLSLQFFFHEFFG
jgi:hypothetical protein